MTINIQDVLLDSTTTFDTWRVRTNEIAAAMRTNVVTVGGDPAVGDAVITGSLSADDLYATNLWGGSKTAVGSLTVKTNTAFQGQVDAVDVFLTGSLSLLNNTKLIVPGATATAKYLEFDSGTNTPVFVHIPRFQDTTRTNGSILIWNSTNNQYEHNSDVLVDIANGNITLNLKLNSKDIDTTGNISVSGNVTATGNIDVSGHINSKSNTHILKNTLTLLHTSYTPGTDGDLNLFIGQDAGNVNVGQGFVNTYEGCNNIGIGKYSLTNITTGYRNIAIGSYTLDAETTGYYNVAIGYASLSNQNGASQNTAIGYYSGFSLTSGLYNVSVGSSTLDAETTGSYNTAVGRASLSNQNGASENTAIGYASGFDITSGIQNSFLGSNSGRGITTGSNNTFVGANINLGNVSNNIALATGDGNVRFQFNGTEWVSNHNIYLQSTEPSFKLLETDTNSYSRIVQSSGNLYIQTSNADGSSNSGGVIRISGYNGGDLGRIEVKKGGTYYELWENSNVGTQISSLPSANPDTLTGNEEVALSTGEKATINDLHQKPDDEFAVGFFDEMPYYNISGRNNSIPFKLKDGGVAVIGNIYNSYNQYRVKADPTPASISSTDSAGDTNRYLGDYAPKLHKKPIPNTEKPGNGFPLTAARQKIIEDWKSKGYFNNVTNAAVCSYAYYVVYDSGIIVGTGRNNSYVFSDYSSADAEGFVCPWDDYLPGGNLDLTDPNKKVVKVYINQGKGADYGHVHPTTPIFQRADGKLVARGYNANGERAKGDTTTSAYSNIVMIDATTELSNVAFVKQLDCYPSSMYAWLNDGSVYVWGQNTNGMLFTGDTADKLYATPITAGPGALASKGLPDKVFVIGGNGKSNVLCYYASTKELYVSGNNYYGQLLDGTTTTDYTAYPNLITDVDDVFTDELSYMGNCAIYFFNKNGLTWGAGYTSHYQTGTGRAIATNKNPRIVINGDINVGIAAKYGTEDIGLEPIVNFIGDLPDTQNAFDRNGYSLYASTYPNTIADGTGVYAGVELANPRAIQGGWTKPYWDANGYTSVAGGKVIIELYGSNVAPTNATDGTLLGSIDLSAGNPDPATADAYVPSNDTTTAYKFLWFHIINKSGGDAGIRLNKAGFVSPNPDEQIVMKKMYKSQRWEGGVVVQSTSNMWWAWGYHGWNILPYSQDIDYPADPNDVAIKIEWPFEEEGEEIIDVRMDYNNGAAVSNKGNVYMWGRARNDIQYPLIIPYRCRGLSQIPLVKIDMGAYK